MKLKCPRCGNFVDTGVAGPGSPITCSCGNVMTVPAKSKTPWWVFLLIGGFACVPCTGILAAIAIPNFIRFQSRAKQSECRANLKSLYVAAKSYSVEKDTLSPDMKELGFSPEAGNRYAYFTALDGAANTAVLVDAKFPQGQVAVEAARALATREGITPGVRGQCPDCGLTAFCAGNIDNDETLDLWSVSTENRTSASGVAIPAGEVFHHADDVRD